MIKKTLIGLFLVIWIGFFSSTTWADTALCSSTQRWNSMMSLQSLFPWVDKTKFDFSNRNQQIQGSITRYDNFANCNNGPISEQGEWSAFWGKNITKVSSWIAWTSYNSNVKQSDVVKLQLYINTACSLWLTADGKIGIKTLNAAMICNTLKTQPDPTNTNNWGWTNTETSPSTWTPPVTWSTGWTTPNTPPQTPTSSSCFDMPSWYGFLNGANYPQDWIKANECACKDNYRKVIKTIVGTGEAQWKIDTLPVCEICDIKKCNCWVKLNTNVPFIGRCLMYGNTNNVNQGGDGTTTVNSINAFPILMGAMMRLLVGVILIVCLWTLIVGGFMMTVPEQYEKGKGLVRKVVWTIAALWSLWLILYLINPNFFR